MSTSISPLQVRDAAAPQPTARQFIRFAFYALDPQWRRLPADERRRHRDEFGQFVSEFSERENVLLRTYSCMGTRGDADFMVWLVSDDLDCVEEFTAELNQTELAGWLTKPYSYFSMTKQSMYVEKHVHEGQEGRSNRMVIAPTGRKHLFVYPFVKTRAWYRLPTEERQRQMSEHIAMGHKYPSVKINTTYSFGLDDQEFVVAFESDSVGDFLDLVHEMRESEASTHTVRDVPSFTCTSREIGDILAALG
jgi:chlorite dismutase